MGRTALLTFLAAALLGVACEDDFSPKSEFTKQLAVFAVLDAAQPRQTVRLAWSYDAELGLVQTPLTDREVAEADVRILRGGEVFVFHDTLVTGAEGSRVRAWINGYLRPLPEKEYRLQVTVPGYPTVTSSIHLPSRVYVRADLVRPDTGMATIRCYHGVTSFAEAPSAFYYRLWVEVVKWNFGDTLIQRREIPLRHVARDDTWLYPSPAREEELSFTVGMLRGITESMILPGDSIVARRVITHLYGLENNFYSYYKIVRGFEDPLSIRLDLPDASYVEGGLGVFGGMVSDSITYNYFRFVKN